MRKKISINEYNYNLVNIYNLYICFTCGRKLRDFCVFSKELLPTLNKPSETFVETQAVNQFKAIDHQMPATLHLTSLSVPPHLRLTTACEQARPSL